MLIEKSWAHLATAAQRHSGSQPANVVEITLTTTASGLGAELEKMYLDTFQSDYRLNGSEECTSVE